MSWWRRWMMMTIMLTHMFSQINLDVDECSANSHSCDINAVCSNTLGSYACACKAGYSGDGKTCTGELSISLIERKFNIIACKPVSRWTTLGTRWGFYHVLSRISRRPEADQMWDTKVHACSSARESLYQPGYSLRKYFSRPHHALVRENAIFSTSFNECLI